MTYRNVDTCLWDDEKFVDLSDDAKLLWLCLLTGPQTSIVPGLMQCGIATLSETLRYGIDRVSAAFEELSKRGMAHLDARARLVRVPKAPRYNPPANPKVLLGWFRAWQSMPDCQLKHQHIEALRAAVDFDTPSMKRQWEETFDTVSIRSRKGIGTVSNSGAGSGAGAVTPPNPPREGGKGRSKPKPPDQTPLPFTIAELLAVLHEASGGRVVIAPYPANLSKPLTAIIRGLAGQATLDDVRLAGAYVATWPAHMLVDAAWVATAGKLAGAIGKARKWDADGRPSRPDAPANGKHPKPVQTNWSEFEAPPEAAHG